MQEDLFTIKLEQPKKAWLCDHPGYNVKYHIELAITA